MINRVPGLAAAAPPASSNVKIVSGAGGGGRRGLEMGSRRDGGWRCNFRQRAGRFAGNLTAKMTAMFAKMEGLSMRAFGKREVALGLLIKLDNAAITVLVAIVLSAPGSFGEALAQQPASPPAYTAPTAPKPAKPARQVPGKPAAATSPAATAQPAPAAPAQQATTGPAPGMLQLIYSPWAKFCGKSKDAQAEQVCFTGKDARTEAGQPLVAAALIEPEGGPKKLFRITLPNPLLLQYGTRVIVDQQPPMTAPFITCLANGCMADYEATDDLIGKLKHGEMLTIQAVNVAGAAISFPLPLVDFAKANEGPSTDPKVFVEQQQPQKLQDELQKRADEALKKLESQGGAAPATRR